MPRLTHKIAELGPLLGPLHENSKVQTNKKSPNRENQLMKK